METAYVVVGLVLLGLCLYGAYRLIVSRKNRAGGTGTRTSGGRGGGQER
jgi:hypothetical protein